MTPIAAYYVMINTERELAERRPRYEAIVPRRSFVARIGGVVETLFRLGKPAAQPA